MAKVVYKKKKNKIGCLFGLIRNLFFLLIIVGLWSFFVEPNLVTVKEYTIKNDTLKGTKAVFAGDFHVKPEQKKFLEKIVQKINEQNPDFVFLIGDYVNMHSIEESYPMDKIAREMGSIHSKYGVWTVLGNHDYFKDGNRIKEYLKKSNIKILENKSDIVFVNGKPVFIAGVEDMTTGFPNIDKTLRFTYGTTILLSHQPDIFPKVPSNKVDLILAGHTHGGQIVIPFWGPVYVASAYGKGFVQGVVKKDGKTMIVTKGLGTSIYPIRFNCTPEIIVINFV